MTDSNHHTTSKSRRILNIDPRHDPAVLSAQYSNRSRLQIRDFLLEDDAEQILDVLTNRTEWGVAFNRGSQAVQLSAADAARLTPDQGSRLLDEIHQRARQDYQYLYNFFPLHAAFNRTPDAEHPLFDIYRFVNSEPFLQFMRTLTGLDEIKWADAHASLYRAGHFLKYHTDETPSERRLAAYVLNFTKGWGRDWGGYLQFFDAKYDVEDAYRPIFNAVNVFTVPSDHSVGMVAAYAPGSRYSVTGWLRGDDPPPAVSAIQH